MSRHDSPEELDHLSFTAVRIGPGGANGLSAEVRRASVAVLARTGMVAAAMCLGGRSHGFASELRDGAGEGSPATRVLERQAASIFPAMYFRPVFSNLASFRGVIWPLDSLESAIPCQSRQCWAANVSCVDELGAVFPRESNALAKATCSPCSLSTRMRDAGDRPKVAFVRNRRTHAWPDDRRGSPPRLALSRSFRYVARRPAGGCSRRLAREAVLSRALFAFDAACSSISPRPPGRRAGTGPSRHLSGQDRRTQPAGRK